MTSLMVSQMAILSELQVKRDHDSVNGIINGYYLPSGYIAPHRVAHDLTERQRELLQILAQHGPLPLRKIRQYLSAPPSDRMIQEDLAHLRRLDLVQSTGRGRGAGYSLRRTR